MTFITQATIDDLSDDQLLHLVDALANPVLKMLIDKHIARIRHKLMNLDAASPQQLAMDYQINRVMLEEWETFKDVAENLIKSMQQGQQVPELVDEIDATHA
jgi:hypothetical protein